MALNFLLKRSGTASKRPNAASMALGEVDINYNASSGGLFYKDSAGDVVKVGPAEVGSAAPNATPAGSAGNSVGEFWYDTGDLALKIWNGSAWVVTGTSGTVTSITAGTGLTGGTITTSGTIALEASGVTSGSYTYASFTVDTYGRVTAASDGAAPLPLSGGTMTGDITFNAGQVIPISGIADATASTKGLVEIGANIDVTGGVISVASATTSNPGIVELNDSTTSTSTTQALTANQGKILQNQITALSITANITLGGTFNASAGLVDSVTTQGTDAGLTVGSALPAAAALNNEIFVIVDVEGSTGPSGTPPYKVGDWFLSDGSAWQYLSVGFAPGAATTTSQGVVELATDTETQDGIDATRVVVPSALQSKLSDSTSTTSSSTIASSTAVKSAYDAGVQGQTDAAAAQTDADQALLDAAAAQVTADAALPAAGGTMTGNITFSDAGEGLIFSDASSIISISDSTSSTSTTVAASSAAVKAAYDKADNAIPDSTFTAAGELIVGTGAGTYSVLTAGAVDYILQSNGDGTLSWVENSVGDVSSVTGTAPIQVDNTDSQNPVISVDVASTAGSGVVQLNDTVTSTSTTQAATANAVKTAYDAALNSVQTVSGTAPIQIDNTDPQNPVVSADAATTTAPGVVQIGTNIDVAAGTISVPAATTSTQGAVQVGTNIDVTSGTISVKTADTADLGLVKIGTNIDVTAGTISVPAATTTAQGVVQVGTNIDVTSGTISVKTANLTDLGLVQVGTNIDVTSGTISVADSSTSAKGVVQLNDTTNNSSTDLALTAAQGKSLQDQISALVATSNLTFAGTFDSSVGPNGEMVAVSDAGEGLTNPFVAGDPLPTPAAENADFFVIVTGTSGNYGPTTNPVSTPPYNVGDWFLSNGTDWEFLNLGFQSPAATTAVEGVVYLATDAEVQAGTDTSNKVVNPASLQAKVSDSTSTTDSFAIASSTAVKSAYDLADAALPKSGGTMTGDITFNDGQVFPEVVTDVSASAPLSSTGGTTPVISVSDASTTDSGVVQLATSVQTQTGTDTTLAITPAGAKDTYVPLSAYEAKGSILAATAESTPTDIALGTDGQILTVDSTCDAGVKWADSTPVATPTTTGTVFGCMHCSNTSLGCDVGVGLANNVYIGQNAAGGAVAGGATSNNVAIGTAAARCLTTGSSNTVVGCGAGFALTTSVSNTVIGNQAASSLTSGNLNVVIGSITGSTLTTGGLNVLIGAGVNVASATDFCQLAIGVGSSCWLSGDCNFAIKPGAGIVDCADVCGTAGQFLRSNGLNAVCWSSATATQTVAGIVLGVTNATNTALGCNALLSNTGTNNTAIGLRAGCNITSGSCNVAIGNCAQVASDTGDCQLAVGFSATCNWLTGNSTKAIKPGAGIIDCADVCGTAGQFLRSNGLNAVCWSSAAATPTVAGVVLGVTNATNAALGCNALLSNTGTNNTAIGLNAGCNITSGACNVAIGNGAQVTSASGNCQLAIGFSATCNWLTGCSNLNIKPGAGILDCAGCCGTAGQFLRSNGSNAICWSSAAATPTVAGVMVGCTCATNAALGCNAMRSLTSGNGNVAIGINAGCSLTTQVNNVFVGNGAGLTSTGSGNVGIGTSALINSTTAGRNTAVGEQAAQTNVTGEYNVALGWAALQNATGGCNTALGGVAGQAITTGTYNVAIGANIQVPFGNQSCQLAIGWENCRWITGDGGKNLCVYNAFVIKPGGGAGPTGVAANDTYFYADGSNGAVLSMGNTFGNGKDYTLFRNPSNTVIGSIRQISNTSIAYVTTSDYRLKENVKNLEGATEVLRALPVYEYNFISEPEVVHQGFLAHELQEFVPLAVTGTKDEVDEEGNAKYQGIDASKVVPLLVAALKESIARIDALEAEVKELKSNT